MENDLVVGILNIVEDKLREFHIEIPDDDRDGSKDPIVGYQYAELHDRIYEFLVEEGIINEPVRSGAACAIESEMVGLLQIAQQACREVDLEEGYDSVCANMGLSSKGIFTLIQKNQHDIKAMSAVDAVVTDITGVNIKTVLHNLASTALDGLQCDLKNVIDASEADGLTQEKSDFLDEQYGSISNLMDQLKDAMNKPSSLEVHKTITHKKSALQSMIQSAASKAGAGETAPFGRTPDHQR